MKTGDLIRALAADSKVHAMPPGRALALALIPGVAIALGLHFAVLGLRPHLFAQLGEPRLLFKLCVTFLLVLLSGALVSRIARPGASIRRTTLMLAIVPALLAAANFGELVESQRKLFPAAPGTALPNPLRIKLGRAHPGSPPAGGIRRTRRDAPR